jgi:hypothetical protein
LLAKISFKVIQKHFSLVPEMCRFSPDILILCIILR